MSRILGVQIDAFNQREAVDLIKAKLETAGTDQVVTVNPEFVVRAEKNSDFKHLLKEASLRTADGIGVSLFSNFSFSRATGVDLMLALARELESSSCKLFLFGAKKGVAKRAAQSLKAKFPDLSVAGVLDGVDAHSEDNLEIINNASPDLLFVALGAGKQERWIAAHKDKLPSCKVAIGVGGAFDILAGVKPRAPKISRRLGLEWLWRFILEPRRAPRIFKAVFYFPYLVCKEKSVRLLSSNHEKDKPNKDK